MSTWTLDTGLAREEPPRRRADGAPRVLVLGLSLGLGAVALAGLLLGGSVAEVGADGLVDVLGRAAQLQRGAAAPRAGSGEVLAAGDTPAPSRQHSVVVFQSQISWLTHISYLTQSFVHKYEWRFATANWERQKLIHGWECEMVTAGSWQCLGGGVCVSACTPRKTPCPGRRGAEPPPRRGSRPRCRWRTRVWRPGPRHGGWRTRGHACLAPAAPGPRVSGGPRRCPDSAPSCSILQVDRKHRRPLAASLILTCVSPPAGVCWSSAACCLRWTRGLRGTQL